MQIRKEITLIIFAIVIFGGLVYGGYRLLSQNSNPSQGVFCTQEALLCPGGSYVGRSGPECEFTACPNQPSFTGILQKKSDSFSLIIGAPENSGGKEVSYSMPLIFKTTDIAERLVGQKVRVFGTFTEGITLSIDHLEELSGDAGDPTLGEVGVGKSIFINGVRITLNKIIQDSRCPIDVQCIQAGWVTANVTLQSDTDKETIDMSSNTVPVAFDSYKISIENVKPLRTSGSTLDLGSYLITFRVRSN